MEKRGDEAFRGVWVDYGMMWEKRKAGPRLRLIPLVDGVEVVELLQDAQFLSASDSLASST